VTDLEALPVDADFDFAEQPEFDGHLLQRSPVTEVCLRLTAVNG
jgi:hypothetical protein